MYIFIERERERISIVYLFEWQKIVESSMNKKKISNSEDT